MKLSFDRVSRPTGLVGVLLLCGLTVVGCSKKEESADKSDETKVEVVTTNPVVKCDDQMALTQLTQSVKSTLGAQSQNLFKNYADNVFTIDFLRQRSYLIFNVYNNWAMSINALYHGVVLYNEN